MHKFLHGHMLSHLMDTYLATYWLEHMEGIYLTFSEITKIFSIRVVPFYISITNAFQFFLSLATLGMVSVFNVSHSNKCAVAFNLYVPDDKWCWTPVNAVIFWIYRYPHFSKVWFMMVHFYERPTWI